MAAPRAHKVRDPVDVSEVAPIVDKLRAAKAGGNFHLMSAAERSIIKAFCMQLKIELALTNDRIAELVCVDPSTVGKWLFTSRAELAEIDKKDLAEWIVATLHDKAQRCYEKGDDTEGRLHLQLAATLTGMMPQRGALVDNRTVILQASDEQIRADRERSIAWAREQADAAAAIPIVMRPGKPQLVERKTNGSNGHGPAS